MKCEYCESGENSGVKIYDSTGQIRIMTDNIINTCSKCLQPKDLCFECLHLVKTTNNTMLCLQCDEYIKKKRIRIIDQWVN